MEGLGTCLLENEQIRLRPFIKSDVDFVYKNFASIDKCIQYFHWNKVQSKEKLKDLINDWTLKYNDPYVFNWAIEWKGNNEAIGQVIITDLNEGGTSGKISFILSDKYWNLGISSDAINLVKNYLFNKTGLKFIEAQVPISDLAGVRVLEKCGFKFVKDSEKTVIREGKSIETVLFRLERNN